MATRKNGSKASPGSKKGPAAAGRKGAGASGGKRSAAGEKKDSAAAGRKPPRDRPAAQPPEAEYFDTVVIGGGVAGLYCAWKLSERVPRERIALFEGLDRLGGRIETEDFEGFKAEFGPMRFEKPGQQKLMDLLTDLGLETETFSPYQAEPSDFPVYDLMDDEKGPPPFGRRYNTLDLMKLGVIRLLRETRWRSPGNHKDPRDPRHHVWLAGLSERDYAAMRREAKLGGEYLHDLGFWNALSEVLSHQALMKIRDLGTFYHLIPENPNAIEWAIFWLRGLNPRDSLVSVKGGSRRITEELVKRVEAGGVEVRTEHSLLKVECEPDADTVLLKVRRKWGGNSSRVVNVRAQHVILAIPRSPLRRLAECFDEQTRRDIDAVFGFPLLKCFFLVNNPWWNEKTTPQTRASLMPTREVHYFYDDEKDQGMVMLYTDRPATEFWKIYVRGEVHDRAEIGGDPRLKKLFFKYLATELSIEAKKYQPEVLAAAASTASNASKAERSNSELPPLASSGYSSGYNEEDFNFNAALMARAKEVYDDKEQFEKFADELAERVLKFGIRDWGREPYGGACHAWRPGAKSWEVLGRLRAFTLPGDRNNKRVHVCGEAYSDYHGFIEGALRSADDVLETIN